MEDELRPAYDLTKLLKGGVRGKYADRYRASTNVVVLAPDVAQAFPTEEAVECCPALGQAPGADSRGH
jgi:hypothetical protein